jgi:DNA (cytosine-5)-methyltransferase 1
MPTAIDLFAGLGGWSTGARNAGINVIWAANHWPVAVEWHSANYPKTIHICQDLHQADWSKVPAHDIMLASPCCQGHSKARGKKSGNAQHDASRSTAWAVVSAVEFHRPEVVLVENVEEFTTWSLYPAWSQAMTALGYMIAPHVVDCADLGVPQHRVRLFLVCTRSKAPLMLELHYGKGSGLTGRDINRPIGTITTLDRWALVRGDQMRMLSANEALAAMSFPADTKRLDNHRLTMHMAGNAVPPLAGQRIIEALIAAA